MTMELPTLPVILSIPHGGLDVPPESQPLLAIGVGDIYNECDLWVDDLFDFEALTSASGVDARPARPLARVTTSIARAIVDMNRDPADLIDPDGAVKTLTSYGRPVYQHEPDLDFKRSLIQRYWMPFHTDLHTVWTQHGAMAKLYLDCHNMAQTGPSAYGDPGAQRPLICLANLGDASGEPRSSSGPTSCTGQYIRRAAAIAEEVFASMRLLSPGATRPPVVAINRPYPGGYILRRFVQTTAGLPGMMIEVNRGLFVGDQNQDTPIAPPNLEQIAEIRARLKLWLDRVLEIEA